MAIPRPVLIAIVGLAAIAAAFLATRHAGDTGGTVTETPVATPAPVVHHTAKPAHPAKPAHARRAHAPKGAHHKAAPAKPVQHAAAKPAPVKPAPAKPAAPGAETIAAAELLRAKTAIARGDAVVFFFSRPGAADDTGAREAVAALRGTKHVTVVTAGLEELAYFRPILQGAGVSQVPAIIVVRKDKARVLQGFVDGKTLRQNVADALR